MQTEPSSSSARVRASLSHPVIDCDGHWLEPAPVLLDYVRRVGGQECVDAMVSMQRQYSSEEWYGANIDERLRRRWMRPAWWAFPANTLDRATSMLPRLLYERLDQFGIDFSIILPTRTSLGEGVPDPGLRRKMVRAMNVMHAELFAPFADRITPAATIPTTTPEEAVEEAEYVVNELGLKVAMISGSLRRPIPAYTSPDADPRSVPFFVDNLALDSPLDYDPMWTAFVELGLAPMTHSGALGWPDRSSPHNFVFNHVGHFASAAHSFARALYLGGVVARFPSLKFAFLEGGVGWARSLCADLVGHWEKRSRNPMLENLRPTNIDLTELSALIRQYGGPEMTARVDELIESIDMAFPGATLDELTDRELELDDFAAAVVSSKQDVLEMFSRSFYFGCEPDDPMTALAFDERLGPRLKPVFGSDISHFDVIDMRSVLEESWELVEDGLIDEQAFRELTFENAVSLHAGMNPNFFKGTVVEKPVGEELRRQQTPPDS
jgi:predicted TIM-barrel fold metal-dependent hydrolase